MLNELGPTSTSRVLILFELYVRLKPARGESGDEVEPYAEEGDSRSAPRAESSASLEIVGEVAEREGNCLESGTAADDFVRVRFDTGECCEEADVEVDGSRER